MTPLRTIRTPSRGAFSLAEVMIALVILGLGLLFIAAALPVGIEYAKRNMDASLAESATVDAFETLSGAVRTSSLVIDPTLAQWRKNGQTTVQYTDMPRVDGIFRPRYIPVTTPPTLEGIQNYVPIADFSSASPTKWTDYEPIIKVRPLTMRNIVASRRVVSGVEFGDHVIDMPEQVVIECLRSMGISLSTGEADFDASSGRYVAFSLSANPICSGVSRVYPPIESITRFRAKDFFDNKRDYPVYSARKIADDNNQNHSEWGVAWQELQRAADRRIAWTAFYRRVSYGKWDLLTSSVSGPQGYVAPGDPLTYELIVVVTQRPTVNHRFPHQSLRGSAIDRFRAPTAADEGEAPIPGVGVQFTGTDRVAPMPWLITFSELPNYPTKNVAWQYDKPVDPWSERYIDWGNFSDASMPTLTFGCTPELAKVIPVGSILIPARNDQHPGATAGQTPEIGFIPSAPDTLPIYTVVDRTIDYDNETASVVVQNNGFYPWWRTGLNNKTAARRFPFWIIPPAFEERQATKDGQQPVYENESPILTVERRIVRLPEMAAP